MERIKNSAVDAVINIIMLDKEKESKYVRGHHLYYNQFRGYYGARYRGIIDPVWYVTDTGYFREINFYGMSNQASVYSVQNKSFNPSNTESPGHVYEKLIIKNLLNKERMAGAPGPLSTNVFSN